MNMATDERGVSAIEFALLLPVMLALFLGTVELSDGIAANRKLNIAAGSMSQMISSDIAVDDTTLDRVRAVAPVMLQPYPITGLQTTITQIAIDDSGAPTIVFSRGDAPRSDASAVPSALLVPDTWLIWSEVSYLYKPMTGVGRFVPIGGITLRATNFSRTRYGACVLYNGALAC